MQCPIITVKCDPCPGNEKGEVDINAEDFDPAKHLIVAQPSEAAMALISPAKRAAYEQRMESKGAVQPSAQEQAELKAAEQAAQDEGDKTAQEAAAKDGSQVQETPTEVLQANGQDAPAPAAHEDSQQGHGKKHKGHK